MNKYFKYKSPISHRYNSKRMCNNWSEERKYSLWRKLWLTLAIIEKELGLNITDEQIKEMKLHLNDINLSDIRLEEEKYIHEVIGNIKIFSNLCPKSKSIIHLGATSCYVMDNADLIQIKDGLNIIKKQLILIIDKLYTLAELYKNIPTLGFTHYQPAQITTFGKRLCIYIQDFLFDFERLSYELNNLSFRGAKGAIGTQASFLKLFEGDHNKVIKLDNKIALKMGFKKSLPITGQTYTRKIDYYILSILSGIAQTSYKLATDIRLLSNLKEVEEPFSDTQIGSSAMPYKKNPIYSERICSLARYVISLVNNASGNYSMQWLERSLDDSANRRIMLPEVFILSDTILLTTFKVINELKIWPNIMLSRVNKELPFIVTENIILEAVKNGGNRQILHEAIKKHSITTLMFMRENTTNKNNLIDKIKFDPLFHNIKNKIDSLIKIDNLIGRSKEQVNNFLLNNIKPILLKYNNIISNASSENINI